VGVRGVRLRQRRRTRQPQGRLTTRRFERYVAIGDSTTEGLDDPDGRGGYRGWANRLAERVAAAQGSLLYANLAIRGRVARQVREEQLERAAAMRPDLATVVAGMNDLVRPGFDAFAVGEDVERMQRTLVAGGAKVLTFTLPDLAPVMPMARPLAGRTQALNQALRAASRRSGATLVDLGAHPFASDPRLWSHDRFHANALGHERIAAALAHAIAVPGAEEAASAGETIQVRLDQIRLERPRGFGDVWLSWTLWRALGLDGLCAELMPAGREEVPWSLMASILVMARLCEPSSELHIAEDWYRGTALDDLLGIPSERVNEDRLYRGLDRLLPHKQAIETHLQKRLGELFALEYDLLLYDVTSTYFEGLAAGNSQAQRGHSRDHRPDCKQVCIALVVTREGIPLSYEVFDGNRVDVTTVEEIVGTMEARFGLAQRVWVMDRGMTSRKNIDWLQRTGRRYVLGAARTEVKRWEKAFADSRKPAAPWIAAPWNVRSVVCSNETPGPPDATGQLDRRHCGPRESPTRMEDPSRLGGTSAAHRGRLRPPHQHQRLGRGRSLADLRPTHRRRGRLPNPQERPLHPTHLAPEEGTRPGSHLRLLPGLRPVEDPRAVAGPSRPW